MRTDDAPPLRSVLKMDLYLELVSLLGSDIISRDPVKLEENSRDKWFASHLPEVVVDPDLHRAGLATAPVRKQTGNPGHGAWRRVRICGWLRSGKGGISLSLARMNRIKEIAVADGVAVVEPGVITGDLQREVRNRRLFYPPDPASLKNSSIGGNIATNAGGPRCLKYGVTRHYVLGLEVVLANGTVVRVGGRTHKNKTGFDLVGLFVGSEGMLGVVTEATLRLLPLPPARASVSSSFAPSKMPPPQSRRSCWKVICLPHWRSLTGSRSRLRADISLAESCRKAKRIC